MSMPLSLPVQLFPDRELLLATDISMPRSSPEQLLADTVLLLAEERRMPSKISSEHVFLVRVLLELAELR
jgi:hypothetical protein